VGVGRQKEFQILMSNILLNAVASTHTLGSTRIIRVRMASGNDSSRDCGSQPEVNNRVKGALQLLINRYG